MSTLLKQVQILDTTSPFHQQVVDVLIENHTITQIASEITSSADQTIDGKGATLMQGWVDIMADFSEPGYEHKETISSGVAAAADGGFAHTFVVPNTQPIIQNKSMVEFIINKGKTTNGRVYPIGAVSKDLQGKDLAEMMDMHYAGAIAFSDGWLPIQNAQLLLKSLEYIKAFDGIIIQMPINSSLAAGGLMNEGFNSVRLGMPGIPTIAESLQVYRDIELLRYTKSRLHFTGVSTKDSIDLIKKAKTEGLNVTCSVAPYHLLFTDDVLDTYDSFYKVEPPLRSEDDRQALIAAVLDGTIDSIASHHRAHEWDAKTKEYEYTSYGMNTLQSAYNMVLKAIPNISMERINSLMSQNARNIFKLPTATIQDGCKDFTLVMPNTTWTYNHASNKSINNNSPLFGQALKGKAVCL